MKHAAITILWAAASLALALTLGIGSAVLDLDRTWWGQTVMIVGVVALLASLWALNRRVKRRLFNIITGNQSNSQS